MLKITKIAAIGAMLAVLLPSVALAHNDNNKGEDKDRGDIKASINMPVPPKPDFQNRFKTIDLDKLLNQKANIQTKQGVVTALGANSFTMQGDDSISYTVNTASATINLPFKGSFSFANIKVGDSVRVMGTIAGTVITAKTVLDLPVNTQPVRAAGTVTATSANTLTLQTRGNNVVTVNTDANTSVIKADGTAGTTADITVGSSVGIKGLWNSLLNSLNAIKIKIQAIV